MDNGTKQALAQMSQAVPQLLQAATQYHLENKRLEARQEAELKAAEARQERLQSRRDQTPVERERPPAQQQRDPQPDNQPEPAGDGSETVEALDQLREEETCEMCQNLLDALATRPTDEQVRGVKEYGRFKQALESDSGNAEEVLMETDVLNSVIQDEF